MEEVAPAEADVDAEARLAQKEEIERKGADRLQGQQRALATLVERPTFKEYVAGRESERDRR